MEVDPKSKVPAEAAESKRRVRKRTGVKRDRKDRDISVLGKQNRDTGTDQPQPPRPGRHPVRLRSQNAVISEAVSRQPDELPADEQKQPSTKRTRVRRPHTASTESHIPQQGEDTDDRHHGWVNILDLPEPTDPEEIAFLERLRREKPDAITAFAPYMRAYKPGVTIDEITQDTMKIEGNISPNYPYSGISNFLVRYHGAELLPVVIPDARKAHVRIDHPTGSESPDTTIIDPNETLPQEVNGIPLKDIVASLAKAPGKREPVRSDTGEENRIEQVDGLCSQGALGSIQTLIEDFPGLRGDIQYIRLNESASRREEGNQQHLRGLGMGHSLFRIIMRDKATREPTSYLSFDPTIAQVDQTNAYDIEIAQVPLGQFDDYVRLRYRMNPNGINDIRFI